jgi:hypothetical protein
MAAVAPIRATCCIALRLLCSGTSLVLWWECMRVHARDLCRGRLEEEEHAAPRFTGELLGLMAAGLQRVACILDEEWLE